MRKPVFEWSYLNRAPDVIVLFLLLALAAFAHTLEWVEVLQQASWMDAELGQAATQGYYEQLLNDPGDVAPLVDTHAQPSALAVIPFRDAGIVREVPTYVRWRMRPNLNIMWNGVHFQTNSLGFRTPEVALEKPAGTYRLLVFGSSNTLGHGVGDDEAYPRLLERWLNERLRSMPHVEVVNLAVSGDSPSRRLQRLFEEAPRLHPDAVLCEASALDYLLEEEHLQKVIECALPIPFSFVRRALQQAAVTAADTRASFHRKLEAEAEPLLSGAYAGWATAAKQLKIPLVILILPRSDSKNATPCMFQLMRSLAQRHGLDSFDLSEAFRDLDERHVQVSTWDTHPSALGHQKIFDTLRAAIERRGGLPGLPLP